MILLDNSKREDLELVSKESTLLEIRVESAEVSSIIKEYSSIGDDDEIVNILNHFNKNIIQVTTKTRQYKVKHCGKEYELNFTDLSSGERLFVVCYMANKIKHHIVICLELAELDMPTYKLFFKTFKDSKYIDAIAPNDYMEGMLTDILRKARENKL